MPNIPNEKISVIVPVYKVEDKLKRCLDSIVNQTYQDLEIILVDDGSPDRCPELCDEYAKTDHRIRVIHKENGGVSSARNAGIDIATGKYVAFVDSDDRLALDAYEALHKSLIENQADISLCRMKFDYGNLSFKDSFSYRVMEHLQNVRTETITPEKYLGRRSCWLSIVSWLSSCNKLYRMELLKGLRFLPNIYYEDFEFIINVIPKAKKISVIKDSKYFYIQNNASFINSASALEQIDAFIGVGHKLQYLIDNNYSIWPICYQLYFSIFWLNYIPKDKSEAYKEKKKKLILPMIKAVESLPFKRIGIIFYLPIRLACFILKRNCL